MLKKIVKKLKSLVARKAPNLPNLPGVYLFKGPDGTILYVGKAKSLKKRVANYFAQTGTDWKIDSLLAEYDLVDHVITDSEEEALLLESHLIQVHQPKFNVLLKDGQPYLWIVVTEDALPTLQLVRNRKGKGRYFGPFLQKSRIRSVYNFLIRTFRLKVCNKKIEQGCLDYHLGYCAGLCLKNFDKEDYLFRMHLAIAVLDNNQREFLKKVKAQLATYNKQMEFEKSKHLADYMVNLQSIFQVLNRMSTSRIIMQAAQATAPQVPEYSGQVGKELQELLKLSKMPSTIDCFDISHFQSNYLVGSCVRFTNGKPDKNKFRRFGIKTLTQQNDYAALQEIVARRYRDGKDLPDLVVIDGGKGQLSAVAFLIPPTTDVISLAKREETVFSKEFPEGIKISVATGAGRLLIALRDYAHHFAISFHRKKRSTLFERP